MPLSDLDILDAFRKAGMSLEDTPNMLYDVRGQQVQLINGVRALLAPQPQPSPSADGSQA